MKNRDCVLDVVRGLCALWIVGFWHLSDYLPNRMGVASGGFHTVLFECITMTTLASFTFISGWFLSKYIIINVRECFAFYRKRFIRFWPLFFVSALSLLIAQLLFGKSWFVNTTQFITTIVGVNSFFPPIAMTLWYFSMIMFCYMVTPLISCFKNYKWVGGIMIYALILLFSCFHDVDITLLQYFPFYVVGLIHPAKLIMWIRRNSMVLFVFCLVCTCATSYLCAEIVHDVMWFKVLQCSSMLAGVVGLIALGNIIAKNKGATKLFYFVSYSSMVAYLFHRQLYGVAEVVFGGYTKVWQAYTVAVLIFIISYCIQLMYDNIVRRYAKN